MGVRGPISGRVLPPALRLVTGDDIDGVPAPVTAASTLAPLAPQRPEKLDPELWPLWDTVSGELDRAGLLSRVDGMALHLALENYALAVEAARVVNHDGVVATGSMGQEVPHPASQVVQRHTAAFGELAKQLGLTFAARARIVLPDERSAEEQGNPFGAASTS